MKYDVKEIMTRAWELYRKPYLKIATFGEALHRSWMVAKYHDENSEVIENAIKASGITEELKTWYGWTLVGREVIHESKTVLQVTVKDPTRGDGKTKILSFFTYSQTAEKVA